MFRLAIAATASAAACYSSNPATGSHCDDSTQCPPDLVCSPATMTCERTAIDASVDVPQLDTNTCIGDDYTRYCFGAPPTGDKALSIAVNIVTDLDGQFCSTEFADACVIAADTISISADVTSSGSRPLVLVASTSITVATGGLIDAASHMGTIVGPGADPADCGAGAPPQDIAGGSGGSFGGKGGSGGGDATGASGGIASAAIVPTGLRGGCSGGNGTGANPTAGGQGGGAVALVAGSSIEIQGEINASGTRGGGSALGALGAGGSGGGAGGMIVLDAPDVMIAAGGIVMANGGGGGEGTDGMTVGDPGDDPDPTKPATVAAGGSGGSANGGDGGAGAAGASAAANGGPGVQGSTAAAGGGGGGGGGAGYVHTVGTLMNAGTISPSMESTTVR